MAMDEDYVLDAQVGFLLRVLYQRNSALLSEALDGLTPTQWAAISKLEELGECSQNLLGRCTAMDAATIKGVVDRLVARGVMRQRPDPMHGRRLLVSLTAAGRKLFARSAAPAGAVSVATLGRLSTREQQTFVRLLTKACDVTAPAEAQ